jgi:thiol:disulfide interchange protein
MENQNAPSKKGNGLGIAGLIVGGIAFLLSLIPIIGAGFWWMGLLGLIFAVIAFFMAKSGNNPKKTLIMVAMVVSLLAVVISFWRASQLVSAINDGLKGGMEQLDGKLDSMKNAQ